MSPNPEKLLIVDGHTPPAETEPYLDYYVKQNYGSSSVSFTSTFPYEKQVFTENIGAYWQTGGGMEAQAAAKAPGRPFQGRFRRILLPARLPHFRFGRRQGDTLRPPAPRDSAAEPCRNEIT